MKASERFAEAARRYLPKQLRVLFIAEAPPAFKVNRLFYFSELTNGDTLFLEMMKVLYSHEVGYIQGNFRPGASAKQMRQQKPELLRKFQNDGYYLMDAYEKPMPDGADTAAKTRLMRSTLPVLLTRVRQLVGQNNVPIALIGGITYSVCAEALRQDGRNVLNDAMINHPARGGQILFRSKLETMLSKLAG
jgi:hypothetical protein